jgi:hypothetical protein
MKHKCPRTRQIPEVAIIVKTQGQDVKLYGSNIQLLSQGTCISDRAVVFHIIQKFNVKVLKKWVKLAYLPVMKNHMRLRLHGNIALHVTSFMQLVASCKQAFTIQKMWPMLKLYVPIANNFFSVLKKQN